MGSVGATVARSPAVSGWAVGRSPNGDQWGDLADPQWVAVAGSARGVRELEDRLQPHRRWCGDRTWEGILDELRRGADLDEGAAWTVGVDAAVVRAHQHAAGARHLPPVDVDAEVLATTEVGTGARPNDTKVVMKRVGRHSDGPAEA